MSSHRCADPTFGLNHQAQAVLALLAGKPLEFAPYNREAGGYDAYVQTFPWYNGREKGFALVLFRESTPFGPCLIVACAECKSSDDIYVAQWEQERAPSNGPTLDNREGALGAEGADEVWAKRVVFKTGRIGDAANHIYDRMANFYKTPPARSALERIIED